MAATGGQGIPPTFGTVSSWDDDGGWGVIIPDGSAERVWAHFSSIESPGYRSLDRDERVWLIAERPGQDSYPMRAVTVRRLDPEGRPIEVAPEAPDTSGAFTSELTIRWPGGRVERSRGDQPLPGQPTTP